MAGGTGQIPWWQALAIALSAGILTQLFRIWVDQRRTRHESRRLRKRLELDSYTPAEIKRYALAATTYIHPDCQDNDPAGRPEPLARRPLFQQIDRLIAEPNGARCVFLLADSGMGKTAFVVNYYRHHWNARAAQATDLLPLVVVPLSYSGCNALVEAIPLAKRSGTVLFLDALDEDPVAIRDYPARVAAIMKWAADFRLVLVTSRTQFLPGDRPVPANVERLVPAVPLGLDGSINRGVLRLYLSAFSDRQVRRYLAVRFPLWRHPWQRRSALRTVQRFADLVSRPLLLTYIEDLNSAPVPPTYPFQVYEIVVERWLERERTKGVLTTDKEQLRAFCQELAGQLYSRPEQRVPTDVLDELARSHLVRPNPHDVRERALLHHDTEGQWKFAHRSIMEYLLVKECATATSAPEWTRNPWTAQMRSFARDMLVAGVCTGLPGADLTSVDLRNIDLRRINLSGARLTNAQLDGADVRGADLRGTLGITLIQAAKATSNESTTWPSERWQGHEHRVWSVWPAADGGALISTSDERILVRRLRPAPELISIEAHVQRIVSLAVSPDGSFIVYGSESTLCICEASTGLLRFRLGGCARAARTISISPSGNFVVAEAHDNRVGVWSTMTGVLKFAVSGHSGPILATAVSPCGTEIASSAKDGFIEMWSALTGASIGQSIYSSPGISHSRPVGHIVALAISSGAKQIMAATSAGYVLRCDRTQSSLWSEVGESTSDLAAFSSDGNLVASVAGLNVGIRTCDGNSSKHSGGFILDEGVAPDALTITPDGCYFAAAAGGTVIVSYGRNPKPIFTLNVRERVTALAIAADKEFVVAALRDGTLARWETSSGYRYFSLPGHVGAITAMAVSPQEDFLVSGGTDASVRVWDARTGKQLAALTDSLPSAITAVAASPKGDFIASGSAEGRLCIWDVANFRLRHAHHAHSGRIKVLAISTGGEFIASASSDRAVRLWSSATGRSLGVFEGHMGQVSALAISPHHDFMVSGSLDNTMRVWDIKNTRCLQVLHGHTGPVHAVAISPRRDYIVSAGQGRGVRVWEPWTGKLLATLEGHTDSVSALAITAKGEYIISASADWSVRVWDARSGTLRLTLRGHTAEASALALSSNGELLISASHDKTVRSWFAPSSPAQ